MEKHQSRGRRSRGRRDKREGRVKEKATGEVNEREGK